MFPNRKMVQNLQLGPEKLKYICNFGIPPYFKDVLKKMLKRSDQYVVCFDESLGDVTQSCQMVALIRYFDSVGRKDSRFLGHSTHRDLFDQYNIAAQGLENCKICQISMDDPSVNLKFLQKVQDERVENEQPALIDIGSCVQHTVHGAFKCGAQSTELKLKEILSGSIKFFTILPQGGIATNLSLIQ